MKMLAVVEYESSNKDKQPANPLATGSTPFLVAWSLLDQMDELATKTLAEIVTIRASQLNQPKPSP